MAQTPEHMTMQDLKEIVVTEREGVTANELKEAAKLSLAPIDLLGVWLNVDNQTRGLVRLQLGFAGTVQVHAFGACHPTPCDWGTVKGLVYGNSVTSTRAVAFTAVYQFNFKTTIVTGDLQGGMLGVETYDHFTDNSGRSDYYSRYTFRRA